MKKLLILFLLFASCSKETNNNVVNYSIITFKHENNWAFVFNTDKNINFKGVVSLDILFETNMGKQLSLHKDSHLGMVLNNPSTHYTDIDAIENSKLLSVKSAVIQDSNEYVFVEK